MKLEGGQLYGQHGYIGQIKDATLQVLTESDDVAICAHAIMEHGGAFSALWAYDTRTGDIYQITRDELRKQPCDEEDRHVLKLGGNLKRVRG